MNCILLVRVSTEKQSYDAQMKELHETALKAGYAEKDIVDEEGHIIYPAFTWYSIGSYDDLFSVANIVNHEIYLYNCTCKDGDPNPKFKILSNFE